MAHRHLIDVELESSATVSTDFHTHAHGEFDSLCRAICRRLRNDSLPPDEAYWWARILVSEAALQMHTGCTIPMRPAAPSADATPFADEQLGQAAA